MIYHGWSTVRDGPGTAVVHGHRRRRCRVEPGCAVGDEQQGWELQCLLLFMKTNVAHMRYLAKPI